MSEMADQPRENPESTPETSSENALQNARLAEPPGPSAESGASHVAAVGDSPALKSPAAPAGAPSNAIDRIRALLSMREDNFFLLLAVIIGLFAGLAVVCFRIAIDYTRFWLLGSAIAPGPQRVLLVPAAAGLVLGVMVLRFFPRVRGS